MRDAETAVVQHVTSLLRTYSAKMSAQGLTWKGPEIQVWQSEPSSYTSELCVSILKDQNICDALEFHIYRNGELKVTPEEAVAWVREQLDEMVAT